MLLLLWQHRNFDAIITNTNLQWTSLPTASCVPSLSPQKMNVTLTIHQSPPRNVNFARGNSTETRAITIGSWSHLKGELKVIILNHFKHQVENMHRSEVHLLLCTNPLQAIIHLFRIMHFASSSFPYFHLNALLSL